MEHLCDSRAEEHCTQQDRVNKGLFREQRCSDSWSSDIIIIIRYCYCYCCCNMECQPIKPLGLSNLPNDQDFRTNALFHLPFSLSRCTSPGQVEGAQLHQSLLDIGEGVRLLRGRAGQWTHILYRSEVLKLGLGDSFLIPIAKMRERQVTYKK